MTKKILAALLLTGSLMVAACNTVEGAGRDVQSITWPWGAMTSTMWFSISW